MRQLITRIDDDLHARLKATAEAAGRSVNAMVVEALERLTSTPVDARGLVRQRARDAGLLVSPPRAGEVASRQQVIESTRGAGAAVGAALAAERAAS